MEALIFAVAILLTIVGVSIHTRVSNKKTLQYHIKTKYGKKPKLGFDYESVNHLYRYTDIVNKENDCIDDITWNDLDMDKVFQRINNCDSFIGEQVLYTHLHAIEKNTKSKQRLDRMVTFLEKHESKRQKTQYKLAGMGRRKISYFLPVFIHDLSTYKLKHIWGYRLMGIALLASILPAILFNGPFVLLTLVLFLTNMVLYTFGKNKCELHIEMLTTVVNVVNAAHDIIVQDQDNVIDNKKEFLNKVKILKKAINRIFLIQRKKESSFTGDIGGMIIDYLIGATLWDFHVFHQVISILEKNKKDFISLYTLIGEMDAAISIASFRESVPTYCTPKFTKNHTLEIRDMYHPLIDEPVCNDVLLDNSCIISGSNASGKSTYIKAIAINMILAQSINTCLAKSAYIPHANVITSMAVRDNITTGESYYIKEIKYLKRILMTLNSKRVTLCFIDEILRGTNTEERIAASAAILRYLKDENCLAVVASHDIELTSLLKEYYDNLHFTEIMQDNEIVFDYKVKEGVATSRNAIRLLSHIGFPKTIVDKAKAYVLEL